MLHEVGAAVVVLLVAVKEDMAGLSKICGVKDETGKRLFAAGWRMSAQGVNLPGGSILMS